MGATRSGDGAATKAAGGRADFCVQRPPLARVLPDDTRLLLPIHGLPLVKDINPDGNYVPLSLIAFKGWVYFNAEDGVHAQDLWVTECTDRGTHMSRDLNSGEGISSPGDLTVVSSVLFFVTVAPGTMESSVKTQLWGHRRQRRGHAARLRGTGLKLRLQHSQSHRAGKPTALYHAERSGRSRAQPGRGALFGSRDRSRPPRPLIAQRRLKSAQNKSRRDVHDAT